MAFQPLKKFSACKGESTLSDLARRPCWGDRRVFENGPWLLTYDGVLVVRETGFNRSMGSMGWQVTRDDLWIFLCYFFGWRGESLALIPRPQTSVSIPQDRSRNTTDLLEVRQKVVPAPSEIPQLLPCIVVSRRATIEEHAIDDGSAADNSGWVDWTGATIESDLRNTLVIAQIFCGHWESRYRGSSVLVVTVFLCQLAWLRGPFLQSRKLAVHITVLDHQNINCKTGDLMSICIWYAIDGRDVLLGFSVSLFATTKPLVPPPMIT